MSLTDGILLALFLMVAGRYLSDWWRLRKLSPHTSYNSLDAAVDAVSRIVAGLHEDIDALRKELRAAVHLPPETQVPRLLATLERTRRIAWLSLLLNVIGGISLLVLVLVLVR